MQSLVWARLLPRARAALRLVVLLAFGRRRLRGRLARDRRAAARGCSSLGHLARAARRSRASTCPPQRGAEDDSSHNRANGRLARAPGGSTVASCHAALLLADAEPETRGFLERHLPHDGFELVRRTAASTSCSRATWRSRPLGRARAGDRARSAEADAVDRVHAFRRGCDDYVARPVRLPGARRADPCGAAPRAAARSKTRRGAAGPHRHAHARRARRRAARPARAEGVRVAAPPRARPGAGVHEGGAAAATSGTTASIGADAHARLARVTAATQAARGGRDGRVSSTTSGASATGCSGRCRWSSATRARLRAPPRRVPAVACAGATRRPSPPPLRAKIARRRTRRGSRRRARRAWPWPEARRLSVRDAAMLASTASPSAPPIMNAVLTMPEASPDSSGATSLIAASRTGLNAMPAPMPSRIMLGSTSTTKLPSTGARANSSKPDRREQEPVAERRA